MPRTIKKCKYCGKEYEACHFVHGADDIFRWQDVACSPECGAAYFAEVLKSRGESSSHIEEKVADVKTEDRTYYELDIEEDWDEDEEDEDLDDFYSDFEDEDDNFDLIF